MVQWVGKKRGVSTIKLKEIIEEKERKRDGAFVIAIRSYINNYVAVLRYILLSTRVD